MQTPDAVGYLNNLTAGCGGMHYIVWGDDGNEQYLFDRNYPGVHNDIDGFVTANSEVPSQGRTCEDDQVRTTPSVGWHVAKSRSLCRAQG